MSSSCVGNRVTIFVFFGIAACMRRSMSETQTSVYEKPPHTRFTSASLIRFTVAEVFRTVCRL